MKIFLTIAVCVLLASCGKKDTPAPTPDPPDPLTLTEASIQGITYAEPLYNVTRDPEIILKFSTAPDAATIAEGIQLTRSGGPAINMNTQLSGATLTISPKENLEFLTKYQLNISRDLKSAEGAALSIPKAMVFVTQLDSSDKFPRISDEALLDKIQEQTFNYFWDFGHPVSGMARERNTSGDVVTTGGTGFGIMGILAGIERNFITRQEGVERINKIATFLTDKCTRYHGAFSHWINGATGATVPFSQKDNGGDLVETSFLIQGLLSARQYFDGADAAETDLRTKINAIWEGVEWDWYTHGENVLYWHWSPEYQFQIHLAIRGWDEALITYVLAASSPTHPITKVVYDEGWAGGSHFKNGNSYYSIALPLGPQLGGPLFFAHYSFLGIDPNGLSDVYANYWDQNVAHSKINHAYCKNNPKDFYGYSKSCWGLTASDDNDKGYMAHSPVNDNGVISPTAAVSSLPYTPEVSMDAIRFFYYTLGDKLFGQYGFKDAFSLNDIWFASSYLAIDQGPQIVMIENYRSGLLWNLFMSIPEVKAGMTMLGFQSPHF